MLNSNEFQGSIEIDGVVETNRVSVYFASPSDTVIIGDANAGSFAKKKLYLQPFSAYMLRSGRSDVMKEGFFYSISGTDVGLYSYGPLGHPGDGEFDCRPIKHFNLRSCYTADELRVQIEGVTELGTSGFADRDVSLPPWKFRVSFTVPRENMKEFFDFTDFNYPFFEEKLDACR